MFNDILINCASENKETIVLGDFKVNYLNANDGKVFKSIMTANGFSQLIQKPTRITDSTKTLIDIIMSNCSSNISAAEVITTLIGDHDMVVCTRKLNNKKHQPKIIKFRNYKNYCPNAMCDEINNIDWQPLYECTNVNEAVGHLNTFLKAVFDRHAPPMEKRLRGKPCPWIKAVFQ